MTRFRLRQSCSANPSPPRLRRTGAMQDRGYAGQGLRRTGATQDRGYGGQAAPARSVAWRPSFRQGGTNSFRRLPGGSSVPEYLQICGFFGTFVAHSMSSQPANSEKSEQAIQSAKQYANEIMSGALSPYEGGRRIWKECYHKLEERDHRLDPFVYWADEHESRSSKKRHALCNKALRHAATALIQNGSAV